MPTRRVTAKLHTCERCGYEWLQRKESGKPVKCAKCRSPYWDKPRRATKP